jgi:hypothetical protein
MNIKSGDQIGYDKEKGNKEFGKLGDLPSISNTEANIF